MTRLVFYSKSKDVFPGEGAGEELSVKRSDFNELNRIKDWRKMLSNFWTKTDKPLFYLDDKYWGSVENFFHYVKFRDEYPEFADTFEFNSGSPWARDAGLAKSAGRAGMIRNDKVFKQFTRGKGGDRKVYKLPENVKVRPDFYRDNKVRENLQVLAAWSKFHQNPELMKALFLTGDAELWHYVGWTADTKYERWIWLEKVRECLKLYNNKCPNVWFDKEDVDKYLPKYI